MGYIVENDDESFSVEFRRESVILNCGTVKANGSLFCDHGDTQSVEVTREWLRELLVFFGDPHNTELLYEPYGTAH